MRLSFKNISTLKLLTVLLLILLLASVDARGGRGGSRSRSSSRSRISSRSSISSSYRSTVSRTTILGVSTYGRSNYYTGGVSSTSRLIGMGISIAFIAILLFLIVTMRISSRYGIPYSDVMCCIFFCQCSKVYNAMNEYDNKNLY